MQVFETIIIFDTKEDAVINDKIEFYTELLQGWCNEKKVQLEDVGIKNLAYEIKNHKQGHYVLFTFASDIENIANLERQLRIDDTVLKFITVKKEDEEEYNNLPDYNPKSEQKQPDALDVLLGLADYN